MKIFENCYTIKCDPFAGYHLVSCESKYEDCSFRDYLRQVGIYAKDFKQRVFRYYGMIVVLNKEYWTIADAENELDRAYGNGLRRSTVDSRSCDSMIGRK